MRTLILSLIIVVGAPSIAIADLGTVDCFDRATADKFCDGYLIGTIEALRASGVYCPDGKTSFGDLIATWRVLLSRREDMREVATLFSMTQSIDDLTLRCATAPPSSKTPS